MDTYNNQEKSFDFSPDLTFPKENVKVHKTSVNFDEGNTLRLKNLRENGVNVSKYVNKVVSDNFDLERQLQSNVYKKCTGDFVKIELLVHKDVAQLIKWLELNRGAVSLANKLAEVIANDNHLQGEFLRGDCNCYGVGTLDNALNIIRRAWNRLE